MLSFIYYFTFKHTSHSNHSIHPFIRGYANRIRPVSASRNLLPGIPIKCQNTLRRHHKMLEILKSFKSLSVLAFFQNCGKRLKNELLPAKEDVHILPFCVAQSKSYPGHFFCVISFISVNIVASVILRREGKTSV